MTEWELFRPGANGSRTHPRIHIASGGTALVLNRAAEELLGGADAVHVLYDTATARFALRAAERSDSTAYAVTRRNTSGQATIGCASFVKFRQLPPRSDWRLIKLDGLVIAERTEEQS